MDEIEKHKQQYLYEINRDKDDINKLTEFKLDTDLSNIVKIVNIDDNVNIVNIDKSINKYIDIYKNRFSYYDADSVRIKELLRYLHRLKTDINTYKFLNTKNDISYSNYHNALRKEIYYLRDYVEDSHNDINNLIQEYVDLSFLICNAEQTTYKKYRCLGDKKKILNLISSKNDRKIKKRINNKQTKLLTQRIVKKGSNFFRKIINLTRSKKTPLQIN